nr:copper uptake system-associated protein [Stenotrophomonas mori]
MHATWDRPEAPLDAGPVVVEGDHAVVDWTQGPMGGRALLKRRHGEWITVLCAGDGIRDAEGLAATGMPAAVAGRLAARLAHAETQVAAERLARMSAFTGVVRMDAGDADGRHH